MNYEIYMRHMKKSACLVFNIYQAVVIAQLLNHITTVIII